MPSWSLHYLQAILLYFRNSFTQVPQNQSAVRNKAPQAKLCECAPFRCHMSDPRRLSRQAIIRRWGSYLAYQGINPLQGRSKLPSALPSDVYVHRGQSSSEPGAIVVTGQ
eukprot:scaffold1711_cov258-Prasinococcus_capsulatus_cf.AAC.4